MPMIMFVRLTDTVSVAGQISPEDIDAVDDSGFVHLVNNRPDGEEFDQPTDAEMRAATEAAGIGYTAIPVDHRGFDMGQVAAMAAVLDAADGPVLAFCRSGTRSANLWALAEAHRRGDPDEIIAAAARGRYDVSGLRATLVKLAAR